MQINKLYLIGSILLPIQIILVNFLSSKTNFIEHYYSNGIYPYISKTLRFFLGWIPFSFGDIVGIILIVLFLKSLYYLVKNKGKNFINKLLMYISFLSLIYFCFYAFWGLNYFRQPLAKSLSLEQTRYTTEQLLETTTFIVNNLNNIHTQITTNDTLLIEFPYTQKDIYKLAPIGFKAVAKRFPQLQYDYPSIKSSAVSLFQSYNGTSGYLNPITGEAQVNSMIPITGLPATTCHEIAHQIGWSAENEANFVGFLASVHHPDIYFKYSGYRMAYRYCIRELYKRDKELANQVKKTVNKGIYKDFKNSYLHWKKYENPIEPYVKKGYNSYLKANNQTKGIASYSYVVDLLIVYYKNQPQ